jgi:hypothetical protein
VTLLDQTLLINVAAGLGVAGAVYLSDLAHRPQDRWFLVVGAIPFWPIYLPVLLARRGAAATDGPNHATAPDALDLAISQVDAELIAALESLDGWISDVLTRERDRLKELRTAWDTQAGRIREIDRLLAQPEGDGSPPEGSNERLRQSEEARRQNMDRLRSLRQKSYDDLIATLAWVRALVSLIHVAKFTGQPAARAEELVAQIAATVEGVAEIRSEEECPLILKTDPSQFFGSKNAPIPHDMGAK